jgi:kynureninase
VIRPEDLRRSPNPLATDYSRFRVGERLLLSGHSHQAWPDVAREGLIEAFDDAASHVDDKWERAAAMADEVRAGYLRLLGDPGAGLALAESVHSLLIRFLSTLDLAARPRVVTTSGEFHSTRRQLARLAEEGLEVERVEVDPIDTLAERMGAAIDARTSAVLVSAVLFETARVVPGLDALAHRCEAAGCELLVDAYHALGVVPFDVTNQGLESAWVVGGGYKYLQLGEGNCSMRVPLHASEARPIITGWFAEFSQIGAEHDPGRVDYMEGPERWAGGTYDPASNYRGARVFQYFAERGLNIELLQASYRHQVRLLARLVDDLDLPPDVLTRDRSVALEDVAGFLALRSPRAAELKASLRQRGVLTDSRGQYLRLGPAPYLADAQIEEAVGIIGEVANAALVGH